MWAGMSMNGLKGFGRRNFLKIATTSALFSALYPLHISEPTGLAAAWTGDLPNLLFITADDVGWKDLSCYGNANIKTFHLDNLARQSTFFENAFGVTSSCSSARTSWLTGQYVHTHGVDALTHLYPFRQLSPFKETLPKYLRRKGYKTAIGGKWHIAPYLPRSLYGYDVTLNSILDIQIDNTQTIRNFLKDNGSLPFYMELNFMQTHRDLDGGFHYDPDFPVDPAVIEVPSYMGLPDWADIRQDLSRYYSQILKMDTLIGEVLAELKSLGLEERTLVVFVSDNGAPYPGNKMTLYDRGIGTPLLIKYPRLTTSPRRIKELVSTIDLVPTFLELAGIKPPKNLEGKSLLPLLQGGVHHRDHVFGEMNYHVKHIPMKAVRTQRWKYIRNLNSNPIGLDGLASTPWARKLLELDEHPWLRKRPGEELYDLREDPHETFNLAFDPAYGSIKGELRELLRTFDKPTSNDRLV